MDCCLNDCVFFTSSVKQKSSNPLPVYWSVNENGEWTDFIWDVKHSSLELLEWIKDGTATNCSGSSETEYRSLSPTKWIEFHSFILTTTVAAVVVYFIFNLIILKLQMFSSPSISIQFSSHFEFLQLYLRFHIPISSSEHRGVQM